MQSLMHGRRFASEDDSIPALPQVPAAQEDKGLKVLL
jgi:hypothetical protein